MLTNQILFPACSSNIYVIMILFIGLVGRVFANSPGDRGSIPGRVKPKTQKMRLDAALLNIRHYKVGIKGKVEQSKKSNSTLLYSSV